MRACRNRNTLAVDNDTRVIDICFKRSSSPLLFNHYPTTSYIRTPPPSSEHLLLHPKSNRHEVRRHSISHLPDRANIASCGFNGLGMHLHLLWISERMVRLWCSGCHPRQARMRPGHSYQLCQMVIPNGDGCLVQRFAVCGPILGPRQ